MRGHARGPFATNSNLRVQNVMTLLPGIPVQLYVDASENDPVFIRFRPNVVTATSGGTNTVTVGTPSNASAYYAGGEITPGTPGIGTAKDFVLRAATTIVALLTSAAIAASKALTISAITAADTQTVTIGGVVYTFHTSLTGFTSTPNAVLIGADATAMGDNLAAAINAGAGAGTTYGTGTVANPSVTAVSVTGVVTVTARTPGAAGNSIAIAETLSNSAWAGGATTLSGGSNASSAGKTEIFVDA